MQMKIASMEALPLYTPIPKGRGNHHKGCSHKRTLGRKPRFTK